VIIVFDENLCVNIEYAFTRKFKKKIIILFLVTILKSFAHKFLKKKDVSL